MAGNVVSVGFDGDASGLVSAFDKIGAEAKGLSSDLDVAGSHAKEFGSKMDSVGSAVGGTESKFMGAADLLDGLGGAFGLPTEGATGLFRAFADLSGGFEVVQGLFTGGLSKVKDFASAIIHSSAVTKIWTGVQAAFNAVMAINPVILIVGALALLVAGLVLAYQKSETFRNIVHAAFDKVRSIAETVVGFFQSIPEKLGALGHAIFDVLIWPYKTAFNAIAKLWNSTVGKLQFEVPSWVPGIGGKGFKMPQLPTFHTGGVVPGRPGQEVPIMAMAGETVTPAGRSTGSVVINIAGSVVTERQLIDVVHDGLLGKQRRSGNLGFVGA